MQKIYEKWVSWSSKGSDLRFWLLLIIQCLVIFAIAFTLWVFFIKSMY